MKEVLQHIQKTCPHHKNKARQALINNRFDLWTWSSVAVVIKITPELMKKCRPCSKRDLVRYQKLIKNGSLPPAIVVTDSNAILDGAHRLQAMFNEGRTEILAFVGKSK